MIPDINAQIMRQPQPGYQRVMCGGVEITALSDGTMGLGSDTLTGVPMSIIEDYLRQAHVTEVQLTTSVNIFLIKHAGRLILVDSGCGLSYGPSLNKLPLNLKSAGYIPEQITDILITHLHDDHAGGLVMGNKPVFPNATVYVDSREGVNYMVEPYQKCGKLVRFSGVRELLPDITSQPIPGHTPGHCGFILDANGQKLLFWGDLMHIEEVQFPAPHVNSIFDMSSSMAVAQRKKIFAEAAEQGYLIAGSHITYPGIGRLASERIGYRWWPLRFRDDAVIS